MEKKQKKLDMDQDKNNKKKKKKKHRVLKAFLIILLMIALFIGGFLGYSTFKNGWGLKGVLQTVTGQSEEKLKNLEEFKVLILGISEDISAPLTDTIMVASYNPRTQKAVLLSIPRDTFVGKSQVSANSYDKINAVYQKQGAEGVLEDINELTGLKIKYYVTISNNALVELVDEIGGVEFDVPIKMDYDSKKQNLHIHLNKGKQKLNGEQAEGLVRFRHNNNGTSYPSSYGDNDYGRMKTQRDFIKAVAKQTLKLKNITKINELMDITKKNVKTNIKDWSIVKDYIPYAVEFNTENMKTATIPGTSRRIPVKTGLWFFVHNEQETKKLVEELYTEQNASVEEKTEDNENMKTSDVKIEVLNGSGTSSNLTKATQELKKAGYSISKTGPTTRTSKTTIANKNNVSSDIVDSIKKTLGKGIISSTSQSSGTIDITIILGTDYK